MISCEDRYTRAVFHFPFLNSTALTTASIEYATAIATNTPVASEPAGVRQHPRQRQLQQPEHEQVDERRRPRVARAVERLRQHHAVRVEQEPEAHDPQATHRVTPPPPDPA